MGLKTSNYKVTNLGITVPKAYARIVSINSNMDGRTSALFEIQQERENIGIIDALERKFITFNINKDESAYKQAYIKAKEEIFSGWEDDIVVEVVNNE